MTIETIRPNGALPVPVCNEAAGYLLPVVDTRYTVMGMLKVACLHVCVSKRFQGQRYALAAADAQGHHTTA
ncbi:hypothetical protein GCM10010981_16780 [Dyella nitratireducens]|uniref:Uncharacterized protein n=1 Tax=Dyella nitratireducens TaxID=1849580 RepID=A0ABQ1FRX8_9GAMM|nr:hypothetical protein GCM10010981_16780 [Dyella nitratireducens]GLQ43257.1 hypothetical protein GCM10007902_31070 [Dyella nitratireducens]